MQTKSDAQLLREYKTDRSETAFGDIVRRHTDLVYSAALRQAGSPDLAGDIAQSVFIDLARKAGSLAGSMHEDASLAGWLFRATRYTALNLLRSERRRHAHEIQIMPDLESASEPPPDWGRVSPLLDEAISALPTPEREALLLRFFQNRDYRAVGIALGVSDDAAQKRVARSLAKLRTMLERRGVTTTTAALSAALSTQAVQAAPAGLSAALISAALAKAATDAGTVLTILKLMSLTKIQIGLGLIVVGGLAATVTIQHQNELKWRGESEALRQQMASLAADNESLSNRLAQTTPASSLADDQFHELLRLRGEVGRLRQQTNVVGRLEEENRRLQSTAEKLRLQSGAEKLKADETEMAQLIALRTKIVNAGKMLGTAARLYAQDNDVYPTTFAQMHNELGNFPSDVPVDTFEMVNAGKLSDQYPHAIMAREKNPRSSPTGGSERAYVFADGSVQMVRSPDGDFDTWEQNHAQQIP